MYEDVLNQILAQRAKEMLRLARIDSYLRGNHDRPYMPKTATQEYRGLVAKSISNWLPLVVTVPAQSLYVEGYRNPKRSAVADAWRFWAPNGMPARQHAVHRGALGYGVHYVTVLPGVNSDGVQTPVIRPVSAMSMTAVYDDDTDDDWPLYAVQEKVYYSNGVRTQVWELYDDSAIHDFMGDGTTNGQPTYMGSREHGLGVCPVVRFRNEIPISPYMPPMGEAEPLIPLQDRLNETTLGLLMAQTYAAFRQRWATGLAIPEAEKTDPATGEVTMEPIEPFNAAVNRLWVSDDPDVKFGEFSETNLSGFLSSYENGLQAMAAIAQIPAFYFGGAMKNISADALVALQTGSERKNSEHRTLFGASWDDVFELATIAAGGTPDEAATTIWRDTEAKNLATTADALTKIATLGVPEQALWELIPGVTSDQVETWQKMAAKADPAQQLADILNKQSQAGMPPPGQAPPAQNG